MRTLSLLCCALIAAFVAMPALALECANAGAVPATAPDDTSDGSATACGISAVAGGQGSIALGALASSPGASSTALGHQAYSSGIFSTAVGQVALAVGDGSVALGPSANSSGESSIALGSFASSVGDFSTALGEEASSVGVHSTAVGFAASSAGNYSAALGRYAASLGNSSAALGAEASSPGEASTALGFAALSSGTNSTALGYAASSTGEASIALGYSASSGAFAGTALGFEASAAATNSTALGAFAYADQPGTVIIGAIAGVNTADSYAKVGIGTTTPAEAVDVERSAAAARFQVTSFTSIAGEAPQFIQRRARGTAAAPTAVQSNDNLGLFSFRGYNGSSMGGSRATITAQAAGTFSGSSTPTRLIFSTTPVGETTPQSVLVITPDGKLQVNGVNLNVPDYVFEDDYELMPLEELRAFIDENGHLPGIPSADEVNAEGHDLGESDMAQLRKIEELTLYTLQQQERIDRLETLVSLLMQERDKS